MGRLLVAAARRRPRRLQPAHRRRLRHAVPVVVLRGRRRDASPTGVRVAVAPNVLARDRRPASRSAATSSTATTASRRRRRSSSTSRPASTRRSCRPTSISPPRSTSAPPCRSSTSPATARAALRRARRRRRSGARRSPGAPHPPDGAPRASSGHYVIVLRRPATIANGQRRSTPRRLPRAARSRHALRVAASRSQAELRRASSPRSPAPASRATTPHARLGRHTASDASSTGTSYGMVATARRLDDGGGHYDITPSTTRAADPRPVARDRRHHPRAVVPHRRRADRHAQRRRQRQPDGARHRHAPTSSCTSRSARSTATGPLPVIVFGHGLFGTRAERARRPTTRSRSATTLCMIQIGTDWIGLPTDDFSDDRERTCSRDLNNFHIVTDRLQQAHVNAQVLTRLFLTQMKDDPALQIERPRRSPTAARSTTTASPTAASRAAPSWRSREDVVARRAQRARQRVEPDDVALARLHRPQDLPRLASIPTSLDQQVLIAALQSEWDYTDPIELRAARHQRSPLPSTPAKRILVQESINDAQVPNLATRVLARTIGLPGIEPRVRPSTASTRCRRRSTRRTRSGTCTRCRCRPTSTLPPPDGQRRARGDPPPAAARSSSCRRS